MIKALSKIYYIDDHLRERERERMHAYLKIVTIVDIAITSWK